MGDSLFILAGPNGWRHFEGTYALDSIKEAMLTHDVQILEPTERKLQRFIEIAPLGHVFHLPVAEVLIICIGPDSARAAGVL